MKAQHCPYFPYNALQSSAAYGNNLLLTYCGHLWLLLSIGYWVKSQRMLVLWLRLQQTLWSSTSLTCLSALPLCPLLGGKLKLRCCALKVTRDSRILSARMNIEQPHNLTFGAVNYDLTMRWILLFWTSCPFRASLEEGRWCCHAVTGTKAV